MNELPTYFAVDGTLRFTVDPRYTPGSRGMVNESTARRVAKEEEEAYRRSLEGSYGPDAKSKATFLGLKDIVFATIERRGGFEDFDLITGAITERGQKARKARAPRRR